MSSKAELAKAVSDAAERLNQAISEAADAGILVEVTVEDDPDRTVGATPYPTISVKTVVRLR